MSGWQTLLSCNLPKFPTWAETEQMVEFPQSYAQEKVFVRTNGTDGKRMVWRGAFLGVSTELIGLSTAPNWGTQNSKKLVSENSFHLSCRSDVEKNCWIQRWIFFSTKPTKNGGDIARKLGPKAYPGVELKVEWCRLIQMLYEDEGWSNKTVRGVFWGRPGWTVTRMSWKVWAWPTRMHSLGMNREEKSRVNRLTQVHPEKNSR